ncbi:MAG: glycoside hydrolase family 9 protein [Bacteroidota bacterium]
MRTAFLWFTLAVLSMLPTTAIFSQTVSPYIHVDQFGYWPSATKVAVLSDPQQGYNASDSYTPSAQLQLRDALSDNVVFSAAPVSWGGGATHTQSGDRGYWFDFSSVTIPGSYYVYDPGNNERSAVFEIDGAVYDIPMQAAFKMFYYNRCGMAKTTPYAESNWTDGNSFLQDANCRYIEAPNDASLEKDLSGGWFDAGDYNKYVTFTVTVIHNLLWAYQENASIFGDNWNIPESGNGIPDILDEVKWELDWLMKMNNPDGSTHIKMGSRNYSENVSTPPSANTDQRYYGPTCSAASIAVAGMFAHAAQVFGQFSAFSAYANELETRAIASWNYVVPLLNSGSLDLVCDDGSIVAGDADWTTEKQQTEAVVAAIHLYELTGGSTYNSYIVNNASTTEPLSTGFWGVSNIPLVDALMLYTTLPGGDNTLQNNIRSSFTTAVNNNWNGFFGFSNADLYRAFMPDWSYHWGSTQPKSEYGILNQIVAKYNISPANNISYDLKAMEQVHSFFGVNPMGMVFLSNMYGKGGDRCVNEIYHTWFADGSDWDNALTSRFGPAPGFMTGGPNANFTQSITPPSNQPLQKSYLEFNDNRNSWEITEPAIYYQAAFVRLLAHFIDPNSIPLPVELTSFDATLEASDKVRLDWTTAMEQDNAHFEIERSTDGKTFKFLDRVESRSNSNAAAHYIQYDEAPMKGLSYYRLKQVDKDGSTQYSIIRSVLNAKGIEVVVNPNPASEYLRLGIRAEENVRIEARLFGMNGRLLRAVAPAALQSGQTQTTLMDLVGIAPGPVLLQIRTETGRLLWIEKIVVK